MINITRVEMEGVISQCFSCNISSPPEALLIAIIAAIPITIVIWSVIIFLQGVKAHREFRWKRK